MSWFSIFLHPKRTQSLIDDQIVEFAQLKADKQALADSVQALQLQQDALNNSIRELEVKNEYLREQLRKQNAEMQGREQLEVEISQLEKDKELLNQLIEDLKLKLRSARDTIELMRKDSKIISMAPRETTPSLFDEIDSEPPQRTPLPSPSKTAKSQERKSDAEWFTPPPDF